MRFTKADIRGMKENQHRCLRRVTDILSIIGTIFLDKQVIALSMPQERLDMCVCTKVFILCNTEMTFFDQKICVVLHYAVVMM